MTENLGVFLAFLAGMLSFLSPCILPLIPSYLSVIGGVSFQDLREGRSTQSGIFLRTLSFVAGFSLVFLSLGLLFAGTGGLVFGRASQWINLAAGLLVITLGLNFIFNFLRRLNIEKRFHLPGRPGGVVGTLLLGMAFGGGWTPCVGPILASILFLAGTSGRVLNGIFLLGAYSLGLGAPFLLAGLFFSQFLKQADKIKPHLNKIRIASGIFLVIIGVLILLGRLQKLNIFLFTVAGALEAWSQTHPWQPRLLFGLLFALGAALLAVRYRQRARAEKPARLLPLRLLIMVSLLILSALTLGGMIDAVKFFTFWFTFQGI